MRADELSTSRAFRTTREAFGYSLHADTDKPDRDWLWFVGSVVVVILVAVLIINYSV